MKTRARVRKEGKAGVGSSWKGAGGVVAFGSSTDGLRDVSGSAAREKRRRAALESLVEDGFASVGLAGAQRVRF